MQQSDDESNGNDDDESDDGDDDDISSTFSSMLLAGLARDYPLDDEQDDPSEFEIESDESDTDIGITAADLRNETREADEDQKWTEADLDFSNFDPIIQNRFQQHFAPPNKPVIHEQVTPIEMFSQFLPDSWFELTASFSNEYAMQFFVAKFQDENRTDQNKHSEELIECTTDACTKATTTSQSCHSWYTASTISVDQSTIDEQREQYDESRLQFQSSLDGIRSALSKAAQPHIAIPTSQKRLRRFKPISATDIKSFLACLIFMGQFRSPQLRDYWDKRSSQVFITEMMTRDRFFEISRFFHLCDESINDQTNTFKIHGFDAQVRQASQNLFYPSRDVSIDEAMVPFKGRHKMRQFVERKKHPTGFKCWVLTDIKSGFVFNWDLYEGKPEHPRTDEVAQTQRTVLNIIRPLQPNLWHSIGMDGFFSSLPLFQQLFTQGFYATSTVRLSRVGMPKLKVASWLSHEKRNRGDFQSFQSANNPNITVVVWMDRKPVNLLSSFCDPHITTTIRRSDRERTPPYIQVPCPEHVTEYHRIMRGVDVTSQRMSYYKYERRTPRWWLHVFWFLLDIAIINSHILYRQYRQCKMTSHAFRLELATSLKQQGSHRQPTSRKRSRPALDITQCKLASLEKPTDCFECKNQTERHRSKFGCETCQVATCIPDCWNHHVERVRSS
jgi:Transposase IS4